MPAKLIKFGNEARQECLKGIEELEKAVTVTLGPKGRCVILDNNTGHPKLTKDGVSVAREIKSSNPFKNIGINFIHEAGEKTDGVAGDGTTTTILLASELAKGGCQLVSSGSDPVEIQKGIDFATEVVIDSLNSYKTDLDNAESIRHIARISGNNDDEIGDIIFEAFTNIGDNGIVNIADSHRKNSKTVVEYASGMEYNKGLKTSYYMNDLKNEAYSYDDPLIALFSYEPTMQDVEKMISSIHRVNKPIVFIMPSINEDLDSAMILQAKKNNIKFAFTEPPGFTKYEMLEGLKDLEAVFNTKIFNTSDDIKNAEKDLKPEALCLENNILGSCKHITITMRKTTIVMNDNNEEIINKRIEELQQEIIEREKDTNIGITESEIIEIKERIAKLSGGVATIMIGGNSEPRIKELKDRYVDAVHSVQAAIKEGIVPGGGVALLKASADAKKQIKEFKNSSFKAGVELLLNVCKMPITRIISSVTSDYAYIIGEIEHSQNKNYGYDAKNEMICENMVEKGIIDPLLVTKTALRYASAAAGAFITTECVITNNIPNIENVPQDVIADRMFDTI